MRKVLEPSRNSCSLEETDGKTELPVHAGMRQGRLRAFRRGTELCGFRAGDPESGYESRQGKQ